MSLRLHFPHRPKRAWLTALLVALVVCLAYSGMVLYMAQGIDRRFTTLRSRAFEITLSGNLNDTESLDGELDRALPSRRTMDAAFWPVKAGAFVFGWAPVIGDNLKTGASVPTQLAHYEESIRHMLAGMSDLTQAARTIESSKDPISAITSDSFSGLLRSAQTHLDSARSSAASASAMRGAVRPNRLIGPVRSGQQHIDASGLELMAVIDFASRIVPALEDFTSAVRAADAARPILANPALALTDISNTRRLMADMAVYSGSAYENATVATRLTPDFVKGSRLDAMVGAMRDLALAMHYAGLGFEKAIDALELPIKSLGEAGGFILSNPGTVAALRQLGEAGPALEQAVALLDSVTSTLDKSTSLKAVPELLNEVENVAGLASRTSAALRDLNDLASVLPDLTGDEGHKVYLVLGVTAGELRAIGGFVSSLWRVEFHEGALTGIKYMEIMQADNLDNLGTRGPAPLALQLHMNAGAWYMRDTGWNPHFPATADVAREFYRNNSGEYADGVAVITQTAFERLVDLIGGINTAKGHFVSPEEVTSLLESSTDAYGTVALDALMKELIVNLNGSILARDPFDMAQTFRSIFERKEASVYIFDPQIQAKINKLGWAGAFPVPDGDRIGIIDSNVGWSKSDRNIERSARYSVDLRDPEHPTAELTLSYRHAGSPAGAECPPQSPKPGPTNTYKQLKDACYWDFFRVYTGLGSQLTGASPLPLPPTSIAARVRGLPEGSDTIQADFDDNGPFTSGLFVLAAGQPTSIILRYAVPKDAVKLTTGEVAYRLLLVSQPGVSARKFTVEVMLPDGYEVALTSLPPLEKSNGRVSFTLNLDSDVDLLLTAARSGNPNVK